MGSLDFLLSLKNKEGRDKYLAAPLDDFWEGVGLSHLSPRAEMENTILSNAVLCEDEDNISKTFYDL